MYRQSGQSMVVVHSMMMVNTPAIGKQTQCRFQVSFMINIGWMSYLSTACDARIGSFTTVVAVFLLGYV